VSIERNLKTLVQFFLTSLRDPILTEKIKTRLKKCSFFSDMFSLYEIKQR